MAQPDNTVSASTYCMTLPRLTATQLCTLSVFAESCIVSDVCPQASIYDNTALYGSSLGSRAVSQVCINDHHHNNPLCALALSSAPLILISLSATSATPIPFHTAL